MEFSFFIYTFLLGAMVSVAMPMRRASNVPSSQHSYWSWAVVAILIYTFFVGTRYNVGVDYTAYSTWYKQFKSTGNFPIEKIEFGYIWLNSVLIFLKLHYTWLFIAIALIQIFFLFESLKKFHFLLPWYFFFFFTSLFMFSSMNIMRQTMAYFIFFFAITKYLEKKYIYFILLMLLGYSLHKSVLFFIWIFPFIRIDWFKSRIVQMILLVFVFISTDIFKYLLDLAAPFITFLGYSYYLDNLDYMKELTDAADVGAGFGKYLLLFIDTLIIIYSARLKETFQKVDFTAYYNLYFLGALLGRVLASNFILYRANDFLLNFRVLILSFLCYFLLRHKVNRTMNKYMVAGISILMLAYFYRGIANSAAKCAPFNFVFEQ